jgi:hypothetical protein
VQRKDKLTKAWIISSVYGDCSVENASLTGKRGCARACLPSLMNPWPKTFGTAISRLKAKCQAVRAGIECPIEVKASKCRWEG